MAIRFLRSVLVVAGICTGFSSAVALAVDAPIPDTIQFNRDIRPILSDNCFACHGFDKSKRKADLRLDVKEGLSKKLEDGLPVVPGKPEQSLILSRVVSKDPDEIMPPPASKKPPLSAYQVALLKKWIEQGAPWEDHWSFTTVKRPAVPSVSEKNWVRNPIDAFILHRLDQEGLKPLPEADKVTLIRRVTLDLTGLPPTPAEVDAFVADNAADAYEKLVDRLLSTAHYGERMALEWLDAARYADTHGYHIDSGRDMTRWREWVIDAFQKNKPYDQFTVEQLAGDLLPNATLEQKIASGFNRNNMVNFEGGAIAEEYRTAYVIDRVNTTGTVFLGLSVACTQCHDHKYDPITQKEYYQLYAFFNNISERGLDGSNGNAVPLLAAPSGEQSKKLAALSAKVDEIGGQLLAKNDEADAAQAEWEATLPAIAKGTVAWISPDVKEAKSRGGASLKQQEDKSIDVTGKNPPTDTYTVTLPAGDLKQLAGVRLEVLPEKTLAAGGPGRSPNGNLVMTEFKVALATDGKPKPLPISGASATFSQQEFDVAYAIDGKSETGWAIYPETGKPNEAVFHFAAPQRLTPETTVVLTMEFKSQFAQHQAGKFRVSLTDWAGVIGSGKIPSQVAASIAEPRDKRTPGQQDAVRYYYRRMVWPKGREIVQQLAAVQKERDELEKSVPSTMVMQELDKPRDTFILMRGAYDKFGDKVTPAVPAFLPPMPKDAPANRLGLAKWLVDRNHPLTSRVTVNRYWQMIFGTGIVKTTEDFGSQGERPSHIELLDWLAADFMESGWDTRRLIRMFVTSAAYRQSSRVTPEGVAKDPENRLLARGTRFRLQAELIRDQALAASGLLDGRIGGQSVSPYQPSGLWEELMSRGDGAKWTAQTYTQSKGNDLYRRTMYTFWKRTCPPPTLATFDAPDRETCTVRRARTNTPLQALVLMNDPTYVEAARKLAERALNEPPAGSSTEERLTFAFRSVLARRPRAEELAVLSGMLAKQRSKFIADKPSAEKLLGVGDSPRDAKLDSAELAAWATVCSVILNLDEAVTRG